jgi:diaminohydroxyphosphoribosylaminopyrimidine deaminase/5-amino-6-(5-phosphoribosylamino)uracil reductase
LSAVDGEADAIDRRLMSLAIEEARRGRPSPNPHVGAVIARGDVVVSVGHHARAGEAHAEVDAIVKAGEAARGATLYCTLEPCNHFGRTPPCTDAIISAGLARVVVGSRDPKPHVPGAVQKLEAAGVSVSVGVLEDEAGELVRDFARHIDTGLPYVVLKAAVTLDGRIATRTGDSRWITGEEARTVAHALRDRADVVLVGVGTALLDDPSLTVRHVAGRDPIRVVLDTHLRTPPSAKLVQHRSSAPTWILHGPSADEAKKRELRADGVELFEVPEGIDGRVDLRAALAILGERDVVRVLAEGGAAVHGALLQQGLAQAAAIFVAPKLLGDPGARPLAEGPPVERMARAFSLRSPRIRQLGSDVLFEGELLQGSEAGPSEGRGL